MKIILTMLALLTATAAYAACRSKTYFINGRVIICTVCCDNHGNCTEICND